MNILDSFSLDMELETKHGINKLDLMMSLIKLSEAKDEGFDKAHNELIALLEKQYKKKLVPEQLLKLYNSIIDLNKSVAGTPERFTILEYLTHAKFLDLE